MPSMLSPNMVSMVAGTQVPQGQACPRPMAAQSAQPASPPSPPSSSSSSAPPPSSSPSSIQGGIPGEVPERPSEPKAPASEGNGAGNPSEAMVQAILPEAMVQAILPEAMVQAILPEAMVQAILLEAMVQATYLEMVFLAVSTGLAGAQQRLLQRERRRSVPLRRRAREHERPKSSIGSVRVESFAGDRKRYLKWKKTVQAQQRLYRLDDGELAMLIYLSTTSEARDTFWASCLSTVTRVKAGLRSCGTCWTRASGRPRPSCLKEQKGN